jgi:hypothetical protein
MARVSSIGTNRKLKICQVVKFEKADIWKDVLGPIPSRVQSNEGEGEATPESEYILQRLIELYPEVLPWHEFQDSPGAEDAKVCVVCKEVSPSAAIDILLIEHTPSITLLSSS